MDMSKINAERFSDEEAAQRRDEIVRVMANTPAQPRVAKRPLMARRKTASTVSGQKAPAADAAASS